MKNVNTKKVTKVEKIGPGGVYDISVATNQQYITKNGLVNHNTGAYYSADDIFIVGRRQVKEGTEVTGYDFILNVEKSRYVREKSKIPISVRFEGGINKWSGMFEIALDTGYIQAGKKGWYHIIDLETGEISEEGHRKSKLEHDDDFMQALIENEEFQQKVEQKYKLSAGGDFL